jgi:GNAT superfamily N-acetyltransferase
MIEHALANGVQPLHSDALLKDGKAFANAVPLPRVWENSDGYKIVPWEHGEPGGGDPNAYRVPVGDGTWRFDGQKFRQDFDAAPEWKPGVGAALYPKQIKSSKVIKTAVRWEDWAAENPGNNLEFRHRINNATFAGEPGADHRIEAILNGKRVGYADIAGEDSDHHSPGEIQMVSVDEPYRMRGIGRSMLQHAHKMGLNPTHSAFLTPDGMEFAEATPEYPSAEDYAWA